MTYPDLLYLRAAEGWLELANPAEAIAELDFIKPEFSRHPHVLILRWRIYAALRQLNRCLSLASLLTEIAPRDERSWRALARTLCLQGHLQQAYQVAIAKVGNFPQSWEFFYDAACYASLLCKTEEAADYLEIAMTVGDAKKVRMQALGDPDLQALWNSD